MILLITLNLIFNLKMSHVSINKMTHVSINKTSHIVINKEYIFCESLIRHNKRYIIPKISNYKCVGIYNNSYNKCIMVIHNNTGENIVNIEKNNYHKIDTNINYITFVKFACCYALFKLKLDN